jgi:ribonuclease HI
MELLAVIVVLKIKEPNTKVLVVSDSKYVVDSVLKNGFWLGEKEFCRLEKLIYGKTLVVYKHQSILNG